LRRWRFDPHECPILDDELDGEAIVLLADDPELRARGRVPVILERDGYLPRISAELEFAGPFALERAADGGARGRHLDLGRS